MMLPIPLPPPKKKEQPPFTNVFVTIRVIEIVRDDPGFCVNAFVPRTSDSVTGVTMTTVIIQ